MEDAIRKDGEAAAFELGLHDLASRGPPADGPAAVPHQLRPERPEPLARGRVPRRRHGARARPRCGTSPCAPRSCTTSARRIDRDLQGTHLELGLDFLKKHGESEPVLQAVAAHHMDIDWPSLEAMIVQAADAISAARPGARRDILESYVKRLEKLEGIADSFKGVSKSFALQAGREIRIMVESEQDHRRGGRLALEGHRAPHRERARVPRPDQGDRDPRDAGGRVRQSDEPARSPSRDQLDEQDADRADSRAAAGVAPDWLLVGSGRRCGGRERRRGICARSHHDRRRRRGRALRSPLRAARRDRPPGARREPERPRGDGRRAAAGHALARAAAGAAARRLRRHRRRPARARAPGATRDRRRQPVALAGTARRGRDGDRHGHRRGACSPARGARPGDLVFVSGAIGAATCRPGACAGSGRWTRAR